MASTGEVDWGASVKSLLSASYSSFNKQNIPSLVDTILKSEEDILDHDVEYECFYSSFAALATHYCCTSVSSLSKTSINSLSSASKVLLRFLLRRLQKHSDQCTISQKHLMVLIKSLCKGCSSLPKSDVVTFTALLKSAKQPPSLNTDQPESELKPEIESKELSRPRLDTGKDIFSQLTSVFDELPTNTKSKLDIPVETVNTDGDTTIIHISDSLDETKTQFANKNILALQQLNGGDILLDVCTDLIYLKRYMSRYEDAVRGEEYVMPSTLLEATGIRSSLQSVLNDVSIVWQVFSLPILEPMTPVRLNKIITVAMSCLYAAITVATVNSVVAISGSSQPKGSTPPVKDDETDSAASAIVQKSLEIFKTVSGAIRTSTRAGGYYLQNFHMVGAWCLLKGLQNLLSLSPAVTVFEKSKETPPKGKTTEVLKTKEGSATSKPASGKSHQGFGVLAVALASQAISILSSLIDDLHVEGFSAPPAAAEEKDDPALCMQTQYTAQQRVQKITGSINLTTLLFTILSVAYKKAASLKKPKTGATEHLGSETASTTSDSNTFYEDDFSSSDDSSADDDDDSEPILGQWFEETLSPEEPVAPPPPLPPPSSDSERSSKYTQRLSSTDGPSYVPDRKEPDGYIGLATGILHFLNSHFLNSSSSEIKEYTKNSLNDSHMTHLAIVIKDLDKEHPKVPENSLYEEFSQALARFNHSLIATSVLSDQLQDVLLLHLGVSPTSVDPWPMTVYPRTLALLAEVLLLRQQNEREAGEVNVWSKAAVIPIWTRFLSTLKNAILNFDNNVEEYDDINVEHMQLLLFLFHSLRLRQKQPLLVQISQTICAIAESFDKGPHSRLMEMVPLPLSRLMLIFDYLLHYLYDPPAGLMEQVQWNLFKSFTASSPDDKCDSTHKTHYQCREVEENYIKHMTAQQIKDASFKPRFYNLSPTNYSNQDTPKIDGLACSFLLGHPEELDYNKLYDACVTLLSAGSKCDKTLKDNFSILASSSLHYHFVICWRLLGCLPPSIRYLETLNSGTVQMKESHVLHTLRWAPRLSHKAFNGWTKDCLVKQQMTTQKADSLISTVVKEVDNVAYDVKLALHFIQNQIAVMPLASDGEILDSKDLPGLSTISMLDAVVAKVQVTLDDWFTKAMADTDPHKAMELAQDLIPATFLLIEAYVMYIRSCLLSQVKTGNGGSNNAVITESSVTEQSLRACGAVISMGSNRLAVVSSLAMSIMGWLPQPVRNVVEKWNNSSANEFPGLGAWRNAFANDIIPVESYIDAIQSAHLGTLSGQYNFSLNASLKHMLHSLVRFCGDLVVWCPDDASAKEMMKVMFPLLFDATTEYIADNATLSIERVLGAVDSDEFISRTYQHVISKCYNIITNYASADSGLDERVLHDCLKFYENHLEKQAGKSGFEKFFTEKGDLVAVLLSAANDNLSPLYGTRVLKVFNKLFQLAEKSPNDKTYAALCSSLSRLADVETSVLQNWLSRMIMGPKQSLDDGGKVQENRLLLQSLTTYIVKDNSHVGEEVAKAILTALIPMGSEILSPTSEGIGFSELMVVMATLAEAGSGSGHAALFKAAIGWLELCKTYLVQKNVIEKMGENVTTGKHQTMLESACYLLSYIADIVGAIKQTDHHAGALSPPFDGDVTVTDADIDWGEDIAPEEEDSAAEDSDDESMNNKLCTFTITQKEFMNQHWYHCHTCKMVDGVGVCTVCAKVCHKDHDVTYAKYGSFFCDCGAKEDGSCISCVKRSPQSGLDSSTGNHATGHSPFSMETMLTSSLRRKLSSPGLADKHADKPAEKANKAKETLIKQIEACKETLLHNLDQSNTVNTVLDLLQALLPSLTENYQKESPLGSTVRAKKALEDLKTHPKNVETTDQLMTATLGSQEGAFENVRMNYSGDSGQQIRQLITSHVLRRVAMCCLTSPHGKRQHLAVSHEKGKITILQLSALLKQADSSKRKLTLTRLATAPIPFTVLSVTGNPCNEDFLAVCGLKDCHVLTFNSSGSVADHLVLHPSLETGNFIIKAVWLPGSQTELAIVTADFVKIYDLSVDAISPQYYFLLPSGKIRDSTFVFTDDSRSMLLMSSSGYIYAQPMEESSHAKHGPFYITNILEVKHVDIKESGGQVAGGGVSIYYSHSLQLLFFSYSQGKTFAAAVPKEMEELPILFPITFKSSNGGKSGSNPQPLVQWTEVPNHPGLVCSMTQSSNNPVILMVKPDAILVQEIKVLPAKAKIQDMVAIRHSASNSDQRTTLILLCEDGSLRIYMANVENTGFWMSPSMQPSNAISVLKPSKKKKATKAGKSRPPGQISFPVDFFEHTQQTNDVEFGGNDILQIYNTNQVKHRLNTTGMYIASTKTSGFSIEINNTNTSSVMVGVRVLVGSQAIERAPSYIETFGRATHVTVSRARWYDLPFTRDESLLADKKFTIFFGASVDPAGITMVDSIKIYLKTKESFGWPEDSEDFPEPATQSKPAPVASSSNGLSSLESDTSICMPIPMTSMDRLLASSLDVLDGSFSALSYIDDKDPAKNTAMNIATQLLTLPTPSNVQQNTKSLLASLYSNKAAYHAHKDQAQLSHVMQCLNDARDVKELDAEVFQRLVVTTRNVAVSRPTNLVKFAEKATTAVQTEQPLELTDIEYGDKEAESEDTISKMVQLDSSEKKHMMVQLINAFWKLHAAKPANVMLAPVCLPGLTHIEATVGALVEIIHAFTSCDVESIALATKLYVSLLLADDSVVSFACKQAMIRVLRPRHRRRRVFIPSPPRCSTPGGGAGGGPDDDDDGDKPQPPPTPQEGLPPVPRLVPQPNLINGQADHQPAYEVVEPPEAMILEPPEANAAGQQPSPLEALLSGHGNFPAMFIPPDADDETMVELAIALSLQDQSGQGAPLNLQGLGLGAQGSMEQVGGGLEAGHLSDTTASAPGSDDEVGSTAATDGSTLRTSPAEHGGSAGSESGGSAVDSISMSGRSSAYGDNPPESTTMGGRSETSSIGLPSGSMHQEVEGEGECSDHAEIDAANSLQLHALRLMLLERMIQYLPELKDVGGVRAIPIMQVVLMLSSDLDSEEDKDKSALDALLATLILQLNMQSKDQKTMSCRSQHHEVQLIMMRLISVFMSRTKAGTKPSGESSSFISSSTANAMLQAGGLDFCLIILQNLLDHWKKVAPEDEGSVLPGQLLKSHPTSAPPDMSPFFLRQYVKGHASDVFEAYPQLLTEMVLRLPYQMKKIAESAPNVATPHFDQAWFQCLCEYMGTQQTPFVRRQVRKLLLYICGSKEKYRQLRDMHTLDTHMSEVKTLCSRAGLDENGIPIILPYDSLISFIEHLKACAEVATQRTINWQRFCQKDENILPFLVQASISLDEAVSPVLLQLLQCALCGAKGLSQSHHHQHQASSISGAAASPVKHKKEKEKDKVSEEDEGNKHDENLCLSLVQHVCKSVNRDLLIKFIRCFLLESNSTSVRWQAHTLVLYIYRSSPMSQQDALLDLMWGIWPELPTYGRKAAQFVDLLGYFAIKTPTGPEKKSKSHIEKAVTVLRSQNKIMANHPNGSIYNLLQGMVDFDGYYLESDPCLVCNNPEVPYTNTKLSAIKVDSKFTTTTQIVKLMGSHNISKVSIRISDLKRTKMVRTINFYYNNRSVQAVVELKNKPGLWHKAKKVVLTAGQTEVKVEFPLPIVACNLMIEYADFYDNFQASAETLQCPRCSASVPANPGVCGNCGENVFQCHKCRAINYDEKDPFLCNACGFCKYAKFDFTLTAKPCCAVDPIENDEDRKKAVSSVNNLLEKADRLYKQLQMNRPALESLLIRVNEIGHDRSQDSATITTTSLPPTGAPAGAGSSSSSNVNRAIQQLAQKYCGECKVTFDELSKIIQKVLASRKELVEYDRQQREAAAAAAMPGSTPTTPTMTPVLRGAPQFPRAQELPACETKPKDKSGRCYGCASSTVEHCITLLRAMATNAVMRQVLCGQGLIRELVDYNLRRGAPIMRSDVRQLLCLLTKDNRLATEELNNLLTIRIVNAIKGYLSNTDFSATVRHEMILLATTVQKEDSCWEQRVRCVMKLFMLSMRIKSPAVLEYVSLPCLRILQHIIKPETAGSKKFKDKPFDSLTSIRSPSGTDIHVDIRSWLAGDPKASYNTWKTRMPTKASEVPTVKKKKEEGKVTVKDKDREMEKRVVRVKYLMEKYGFRWLEAVRNKGARSLRMVENSWLKRIMFSPSSRAARQTACSNIESVITNFAKKKEMIDLLTRYIGELGVAGESGGEFLSLYKRLISSEHWKCYLAIKGVLPTIGFYISREIEELTVLEETTLSSDLSQGYALKALTELLATLIDEENVKKHYKNRLVGTVLNGYLSLRKLVVQRTKLVDETQEKLLELLEEMTTGTEAETKEFMAVCVQTAARYPLNDMISPVFIFERLCSIIYPEENDIGEIFMSLEKDPQQEDFLQGRMLGNPYSSNEPGLGPLMRDVKNKICQDCELVALLEDDTGMELLVNNKIISLELPVKDVYKKIWVPDHGDGEAMRIVYRMRGLLGDATEDMVNTLDSGKDEDQDHEEIYKMANVMSDCEGLTVMLQRLAAVRDLVSGKQLMTVLLKLFAYCVKVKSNRQQLIRTEMNTISIMLGALNLALLAEQESGSPGKGQTLTEQILQIMEVILMEGSNEPPEKYKEFSKLCGDSDQLMMLLDRINSPFVRCNTGVLQALMRLIPFLAFGEEHKMLTLINHFKTYLDYNKYDEEHTQDEQVHLDCFCVIAQAIESNANGQRLKDLIVEHGIVKQCLSYIHQHAPPIKTLLATDSEDWKEFISKPSLPYALRVLTGLSRRHIGIQQQIGKDIIPVLHKLEQVSSDEHIGTMAENLMEALKENQQVKARIEDIRQQTKAEKKKLAMAMRQKQLGALGMTTNERGQVTVKSSVLKQMEDLKEETGLTCVICREGYRYQPAKVLGIYTFTKRVNQDDGEIKPRKTQGYSTVSHFNIVHIDCHMAAVRHARVREEWDSAALQNANTKCNGLLPLWGAQVPESAFASCLARHNTYLQECTGVRDASYAYTLHDLKHLLLKFAHEKSFSEDSGGGGRESNVKLVPYLIHMALYVLNTTRSVVREEKNVGNFLKATPDKWIESSFEVDGPFYWGLLATVIQNKDKWKDCKVEILKRILVATHVRHTMPTGGNSVADKTVKDYSVYKPNLLFFWLLDSLPNIIFKKVNVEAGGSWSVSLAEYIRHNDQIIIEQADKMLATFEEELIPCESFDEFCDVAGLLEDISAPTEFLTQLMGSLP